MYISLIVLNSFSKLLTRKISQSRASFIGDHFLDSHDLNIEWIRGDHVRRN